MSEQLADLGPCESQRQRALWIISIASFLWSCSSLMVFSIFPSFLTEELGLSHGGLGLIEGLAVGMSFAVQVIAGVGSDYLRRRHLFIRMGTFLSALAKLGFAAIFSLNSAILIRLLDRLSKGVRAAPTEAYLADIGAARTYGYVFGLRQSLYTFGAVVGAALAMLVLHYQGQAFRLVFLISSLPAFLALAILVKLPSILVPHSETENPKKRFSTHLNGVRALPTKYWLLMLYVFPLMLARFSEAFLALRLRQLGLSLELIPLVIVVMDIVHFSMALPAGYLADRIGKSKLLVLALSVQIWGGVTLYLASNIWSGLAGIILIGLNMGASQGVLRASIAERCPGQLRGSGFAIFYVLSGVAALLGNTVAGQVSEHFGLKNVFLLGAGGSVLAFVFLIPHLSFERRLFGRRK